MAAAQAPDYPILANTDWFKVGWGAALVGCGGDLVTTAYGLQMGHPEQNPFVLAVLGEFGILGLVGLKLIAFLWVFIIGHSLGRQYGAAAAFGLAIPQLLAVGLNLVVIT